MVPSDVDQTLGEALGESLGRLELAVGLLSRPGHVCLSPLVASAVANASGAAILNFDPVPRGERWELRRLIVGGVTWGTTAAGSAVVYKTSGPLTSSPPLGAVLDQAATLPAVAFYLVEQAVLVGGEMLAVAVTGGTASQQYLAVAQVVAVPDR